MLIDLQITLEKKMRYQTWSSLFRHAMFVKENTSLDLEEAFNKLNKSILIGIEVVSQDPS